MSSSGRRLVMLAALLGWLAVTAVPTLWAARSRPATAPGARLPAAVAGFSVATADVRTAPLGAAVLCWEYGPGDLPWQPRQWALLAADRPAYRKVTDPERGPDLPPLLRPDGGALAIGADDRVDVVDLSTGRTRAYPSAHPVQRLLAWSADGSRLLFVARFRGDAPDTGWAPSTGLGGVPYLMDLRSGAVTAFTGPDVPARLVWAAFDPDGTRVALQGGTAPVDPQSLDTLDRHIVVTDLDGATQHTIPVGDGVRLAGAAAFSPDGRELLVADGGHADYNSATATGAGEGVAWWTVDVVSGTVSPLADVRQPIVRGLPLHLLGWVSAHSLLMYRGADSTVWTVDLAGLPVRVSTVDRDPSDDQNVFEVQAAYGRLAGLGTRPGDDASPDRGPWPWWWRGALAGAAFALAGWIMVGWPGLGRSAPVNRRGGYGETEDQPQRGEP